MEYYVYILYSKKCDRYYVGHSYNVERRLEERNSGRGVNRQAKNAFATLC
ncbi:GIY-YIG nuclease family protein [Marivirga sp.]